MMPERATVPASVVVCTKDRTAELARFWDSLDSQTVVPMEFVIVDGGSDTRTADLVNARAHGTAFPVRYVASEAGLTRQRNIGVKVSRGEYLFFFDDDVVIDKKYVEIVLDGFRGFRGQNVRGVSGRIANAAGKAHGVDRLFRKWFFLIDQGQGRLKLSGFPEHRVDETRCFIEVVPGGCGAFAREVFLRESFDENLSGYCYLEDVDFSTRVARHYRLLYEPAAVVYHYPTTYKTANIRALRRELVRNHRYLFRKNSPKDAPHVLAFGLSLAGLLLYNAIVARNRGACVGIVEGLLEPSDANGKRRGT